MMDLEGNIVHFSNPSRRGPAHRINASYYGYKDEEDGVLARVEGPTETKMRAEAEEEEDVVEEEKREREEKERKDKEREFVVHVPLPGENDIERMIVERKKMKL
ncbi:hypothetical protein Goklo_028549 [Gossypium klotzschianum]|uniref:Uncharacterized protein n=1 Tax=Gossypium klotzschianum TaxID=34286 RepID=A0A7J8U1Z3_9ROSI|nr:hypothetical protein [Gossypium klotzschianum]